MEEQSMGGTWDKRYRRLEEGEIICAGDELLCDDDLTWLPAIAVGTKAPNSDRIAHRVYRRALSQGTDHD